MDNEITNELTNYRAERLFNFTSAQVAQAVHHALKRVNGSSENGSLFCDETTVDWVRPMWDECVRSAELTGALVYGDHVRYVMDISNLSFVPFDVIVRETADRVAKAVLVILGLKG